MKKKQAAEEPKEEKKAEEPKKKAEPRKASKKADVKEWLKAQEEIQKDNEEAASNLAEVCESLPDEVKQELADKHLAIDEAWDEEIDFGLEHSKYLPYSDRKVWDSPENEKKGKELHKTAMATEEAYYSRLKEAFAEAGWVWDDDNWGYKQKGK